MLENTFCHIPGIGIVKEKQLWDSGIHTWDHVLHDSETDSRNLAGSKIQRHVAQSRKQLEKENLNYFAERLPSNQHWRLFPYSKHSIAYLDIETTGLDYFSEITTIALYDGESVYYYINGKDLEDFKSRIKHYKVIVTFNGKCFDVPFLERFFGIRMNHAHIDLRYVLKSLGYSGGLKACEAKLGISRGELEGIDGYFAVLLWHEYQRNGNEKALETLLSYNIEDVLNLEHLMTFAFNKKLKQTPFFKKSRLKMPEMKDNPFKVDSGTVSSVRKQIHRIWQEDVSWF